MISEDKLRESLIKAFPAINEKIQAGKRLTIGQQKDINIFTRGFVAALRTDEHSHVPPSIVICLMSGREDELFKQPKG